MAIDQWSIAGILATIDYIIGPYHMGYKIGPQFVS